ncbi:hypothetical protein EOD42_03870 [Rhodovarius crocodyli]|uniref:Glycosyltransferase n=1 Tax=Rhodovarius crocodyli TaxID=1979269 RepID=A0A437MNL2_9PROT|nr:hypothetical protein [Rhodovarius crocodyli]RVT99245.1 hypothetical protein EOD42_03870 [Rhodovarius crocodyli]
MRHMAPAAPDVSIIIPASGTAVALRQAVQSIGPADNVEILLVTEREPMTVPDDPRIIVLKAAHQGPNAARNLALQVARAPLVAFLNPADRWMPGKLAAQMALHSARTELGLSFTDYRMFGAGGRESMGMLAMASGFAQRHGFRSLAFALGDDAMAQIFSEEIVGTSTVMARTDLLRAVGGFDEGLGGAAPWDLWLRMAALAPVGCVPRIMMEQRLPPAWRRHAEAPERLAQLREVARRHRESVRLQNAGALKDCAARLLVREAEARDLLAM